MNSGARIIGLLIVIAAQMNVPNAVAFGRNCDLKFSAACANAQNKPDAVVGSVIEINAAGKSAKIKTDSGETVALKTDDNTTCVRIPAGEKSLGKATAIQFADIAFGDRVLAHGTKAQNEFLAQRLIVLTKSEIEKKRQRDLDEWRRRGIGGIVRGVNVQTGEIDLELRGPGTGGHVSVASSAAQFRRYSPGSLNFEDASPSSLSDLKAGDQLRALGDKSSDGRGFSAETIVSGAFKTIGATVIEINLQANELKVTTLDKKEPIVISITKDTTVSRILQPVAATLAQKAAAASRPPASGPAPSAQRPAANQKYRGPAGHRLVAENFPGRFETRRRDRSDQRRRKRSLAPDGDQTSRRRGSGLESDGAPTRQAADNTAECRTSIRIRLQRGPVKKARGKDCICYQPNRFAYC